MPAAAPTFPVSDRFQLLRRVGAGGMGVVYEVQDLQRNVRVALKVLSRLSPAGLYLFKQEFRSLAGITHPNLATLYELHSMQAADAEERWFFTMEFVEGVDFLRYLRGQTAPNAAAEELLATRTLMDAVSASAPVTGPQDAPRPEPSRIRPAFRQLVEAVAAIHTAGKLHRDLKPSNVLVTAEGRVVVLDFGLIADIQPVGTSHGPRVVAGTYPYMSPEQMHGDPLSPASDWYAVGIMLYEALTGIAPFRGSPTEMLAAKLSGDLAAPRDLSGDLGDLAGLSMALLRRDPERRPSSGEILSTLAETACPQVQVGEAAETMCVGRERELAALDQSFERIERGGDAIVFLHGSSGIGKSVLADAFLTLQGSLPGVVILKGRCYEQESMPYKTLDSLLDSLSRYLVSLYENESLALLPRHAAALGRVFPVLRRVKAIDEAPDRAVERGDAYEIRRLAFGALRELLARLADRSNLILYIDDLQWGDAEGARYLMDILRPPDAPPLLLIASYRDENVAGNECLADLLRAGSEPGRTVRDLPVEPLPDEEARRLVRRLLGEHDAEEDRIIEEAGGNPYLLRELTRRAAEPSPAAAGATLDTVLGERVRNLPQSARLLLEVVAVSGRPLRYDDACRAAGFASQDPQILALLRSGHFLRGAGAQGAELETYHDRIREVIVGMLEAGSLRVHHRKLAEIFAAGDSVDPEIIAIHYEGAGERALACHYFQTAAGRADSTLAFRHAASLIQRALQLSDDAAPGHRALEIRLANALSKAGFSAEAAVRYQALAEQATGDELFELDRKSAYCYAISGHIEEGKAAFRRILKTVGLTLPETPAQALRSVLASRMQLWFRRGIRFTPHQGTDIPEAVLRRIDTAWSAATALTMVDLLAGASFTTRHLLLALAAGEPNRVARGLAWEAVVRGTAREDRPTADTFIQAATRIAAPLDQPYTRGIMTFATALNQCSHGHWRLGLSGFEEAQEIFTRQCPDAAWERSTLANFRLFALYTVGEWNQLAGETTAVLADARERGDLYSLTLIGGSMEPLALMFADGPEAALKAAAAALAAWTAKGFHFEHIQSARVTIWIKLYQGDYHGAWNDIQHLWPILKRNYALRSEWDRIGFYELRARCAMAILSLHRGSREHHAILKDTLRHLKREPSLYGMGACRFLEAGQALLAGDTALASDCLAQAVAHFTEMGAGSGVATLRYCLGRILNNDCGRALVAEADQELQQAGVRNPARLADSILPMNVRGES